MIRDLSESLKAFLESSAAGLPELDAARIVFDRPSDTFTPSQATLSLYLFDVRQNLELRSTESQLEWVGGQARITRAPMRVTCTYLVTAWPGSGVSGDEIPLTEHQLLGQALSVFARFPHLPANFLKGALAGQGPPLPVMLALPEGAKGTADFWTALGGKLRPAISVAVTFSLTVPEDAAVAPPVTSSQVVLKTGGAVAADYFEIGGRVLDGKGGSLADVAVSIKGGSAKTTSDVDGRYRLGRLAKDHYVLLAVGNGLTQEFEIDVPGAKKGVYDLTLK